MRQEDKRVDRQRCRNRAKARDGRKCISNAKRRAKVHNIIFEIDYDYAISLMPSNMVDMFGGHMQWKNTVDGSKISGPQSPTIDRIDSTKGYIKGNIQWLTHEHNTMKQRLTIEEFLTKIRDISAYIE